MVELQDNAILTVQEIKDYLQFSQGNVSQDDLFRSLINAASDKAETFTFRRLIQQVHVDRRYNGSNTFVLTGLEWPIVTIENLEVNKTVQTIWFPGDPGDPDDKDVYVMDSPTDPKRQRWALYRWLGWPAVFGQSGTTGASTRWIGWPQVLGLSGVGNIKISYTAGYGNRRATLVTTFTDPTANLSFRARPAGVSGNLISIELKVSGVSTPLSVSVSGQAITVNLQTDGGGLPISSAAAVIAAIQASTDADALVLASLPMDNHGQSTSGAGIVTAVSPTKLTGGLNTIYAIPGDLKMGAVFAIANWWNKRDKNRWDVASRSIEGQTTTFIQQDLPKETKSYWHPYRRGLAFGGG